MKERIISGLIMVLVVLLAIIYLSPKYFSIALLIVSLIGAYEWRKMLPKAIGLPYQIIVSILLIITLLVINSEARIQLLYPLSMIATIWILIALVIQISMKKKQEWFLHSAVISFTTALTLIGFLIALSLLKYNHNGYLIYIIALVGLTDSGAYFVGRKFGKHKLAPSISPGKTREGALGGLSIALIFSMVIGFLVLTDFTFMQKISFIAVSLLAAFISIYGDLYESLIKRHSGVKDSGNIIPGHGGVLDRIDALMAGSVIFTFGLLLILSI